MVSSVFVSGHRSLSAPLASLLRTPTFPGCSQESHVRQKGVTVPTPYWDSRHRPRPLTSSQHLPRIACPQTKASQPALLPGFTPRAGTRQIGSLSPGLSLPLASTRSAVFSSRATHHPLFLVRSVLRRSPSRTGREASRGERPELAAGLGAHAPPRALTGRPPGTLGRTEGGPRGALTAPPLRWQ